MTNKRTILTIGFGVAATVLGLALPQSSQAQATLGCKIGAGVNTLSLGQAVQRTCADGSGTGSAQFKSTTGLTKTFSLNINLKRDPGLNLRSSSNNIINSAGATQCSNPPVDTNPTSNSLVARDCTVSVANAINMRMLVADGAGP